MLWISPLPPHLPNPLSQFFKIINVHPSDKLLSVDVMDGKNVILVEDDLVSLIQSMQPSLDEWIVHDASEEARRPFFQSNPEIFSPATGWNSLLGKRHE